MKIQYCKNLLFRVVEIHRICEATATPFREGANLSEISNNKRMRYEYIKVRLWRTFLMHRAVQRNRAA